MASGDNTEKTPTSGLSHRFIESNGIQMHIAEEGKGPLVLLGPFSGAKITQPALFIWGDTDPVFEIPGLRARLERMPNFIPNLRELSIAGCGHWIQQERATEVNEAMLSFLQRL